MVQAATITTLLTVLAASFGAAQAAVPLWYQCGGIGYTGETTCVEGAYCEVLNQYESQCVPIRTTTTKPTTTTTTTKPVQSVVPLWYQCGGIGWTGGTICVDGAYCEVLNQWHHQCIPIRTTTTK